MIMVLMVGIIVGYGLRWAWTRMRRPRRMTDQELLQLLRRDAEEGGKP
jgi:hypothetical protein